MCVSWLSLYTFAEVQLQKSLVRRCRRCDEEEIEKLKCPISLSFSFHHSFAINLKEFKESNTFLCMLAIFFIFCGFLALCTLYFVQHKPSIVAQNSIRSQKNFQRFFVALRFLLLLPPPPPLLLLLLTSK